MIPHHGEVPGIERNKTHIFSGHGVAGIVASKRVDFAAVRVDFRSGSTHVVAQIEPQDHHRELDEVEGSRNRVILPPEVAGGRKWVRVGFGIFLKLNNLYRRIIRRQKVDENFYRRTIRR